MYIYIYGALECSQVLLCMCTHTATNVSAYCYMFPHDATNVYAYCCACVLILLYLCPHTAMYVSLYNLDEGDKKTSEVGVDNLEAKVLRNRRVFILQIRSVQSLDYSFSLDHLRE